MDLLTRGRNRNYNPKAGGRHKFEKSLLSITKVGLAFDESDARAVIAEFPQICLYDIHELEDRIKFMISPYCTRTMDETLSCKFEVVEPKEK